ncbi:ATP-binding protein [Goekera deserti]|uniref:Sensor histidine kinase n=1 Tax=Goekera deserti TaxID=2497753 RepID=A0A7K3WBK5_9ACTN|nr:ATP-binding protein [Goekera deserti]NDI48093.1 hypothetical protein [Goekera deserti]NEL53842.1 sensor histidine kinase [Goekera deserti]
MVRTAVGATRYRHEGHFRGAHESTVTLVCGVVTDALAHGRHVVLCCDEAISSDVLAALGSPPEVVCAPAHQLDGRTPVALAAHQDLISRELPDQGELLLVTDASGTSTGWDCWMHTEALLNHTLAEQPVQHLCLIDLSSAPEEVQAVAHQTHPLIRDADGVHDNDAYLPPDEVLRAVARTPEPDPLEQTEPALTALDIEDPRVLRRRLGAVLRDSALSEDAAQDFVLAIDEVTANAAEHGVPPVDVRLWASPEKLICAVTDRGACFDDPLAGYGPAHRGDPSLGGMGLWLARRSVDQLTAAPTSEGGCTVRLVVSA